MKEAIRTLLVAHEFWEDEDGYVAECSCGNWRDEWNLHNDLWLSWINHVISQITFELSL